MSLIKSQVIYSLTYVNWDVSKRKNFFIIENQYPIFFFNYLLYQDEVQPSIS